MRRTPIYLAALVVVALAVAPAFAAKPSSSSISLVGPAGAAATSSVSFGSLVTFNVATTATSYPWVETDCYQGSKLVYAETHGFPAGVQPMYQVGPTPSWPSGSAACTATLFSYENAKRHDLASTSFNVG